MVGNGRDALLSLAGGANSDEDGRFELAVPAGRSLLNCYGDYISVSAGVANVEAESGQTIDADVLVIHRRTVHADEKVFSWTGASPEPVFFGFRVQTVKPGTPADRAGLKPGDRFVSVDGVSLDRLGLGAIRTLIDDRPIGASFPVQLLRGDRSISTTLSLIPND
jgi:S1-C subfamily serine protease